MDYIFTQKELSCLDDVMPEMTKKSKDSKLDLKDVNDTERENEKVSY